MYKTLIIDRQSYNINLLESMPVWDQTSGFSIAGRATNGKEALELLRTHSYDLVITEIHVPLLDGLQLLRHINQEALCPIVVILSETTEFQYVRECIIFGAFDYLQKIPDSATLLKLFERAKEHLVSLGNVPPHQEWDYPINEERRILQDFISQNPNALSIFETTLNKLYDLYADQPLQADMLSKKFYLSIITHLFNEFKWLYYYTQIDDYKKLDYLWVGSATQFRDFFIRKLTHLFELIKKYLPYHTDSMLKEILIYILSHPEEDLKLKTISSKFFLNHTYLSSDFSLKTGMHYSDYMLMVKMARAEFLLKNTTLKIYEICHQLGYQDTNHFSKQFKKYYDICPKSYREAYCNMIDYSCL